MKQVVKAIPEQDYIYPSEVSILKCYGFILNGNSPGWIQADDMCDNPYSFQAKFFSYMTQGNSWGTKFETLIECVENILNDRMGGEVFEFETYKELFAWASTLKH